MNVFEEILLLPGAAPILANKLSGRIISRVADGFDADPALGDMMNLYRAIETKWPDTVLSLREMFDLQLKDASQDNKASESAVEGLTPEQRAIWESEPTRSESRVQRLQKALPKIVDLYAQAKPEADSWDDLTTINQWSLLNALERSLHSRLQQYRQWAKEDEDKGRTESNAITRRDDAEDAVQPLYDLITDFLTNDAVAQDLAKDAENGIRVPVRAA